MKTNQIRTILVDDEEHCIDILKYELESFDEIEIIGTCSDGHEALTKIQKEKPDLVFLDIDMPYLNGFDVIREVDPIDFNVVFVTAFDQYALKAFRYSALDYLLKPVEKSELAEAIEKVKRNTNHITQQNQVNLLLNAIESPRQEYSKILLPAQDGLEFVALDDIVRCQADSNYTHVYLQSGRRLIISKPLKQVEKLLDDDRFFRTHQSHLVHLDKIKRYARGEGGYLVMNDESIVHVARGMREKLLNQFK
jgi:two-component system LytT family response regulator